MYTALGSKQYFTSRAMCATAISFQHSAVLPVMQYYGELLLGSQNTSLNVCFDTGSADLWCAPALNKCLLCSAEASLQAQLLFTTAH